MKLFLGPYLVLYFMGSLAIASPGGDAKGLNPIVIAENNDAFQYIGKHTSFFADTDEIYRPEEFENRISEIHLKSQSWKKVDGDIFFGGVENKPFWFRVEVDSKLESARTAIFEYDFPSDYFNVYQVVDSSILRQSLGGYKAPKFVNVIESRTNLASFEIQPGKNVFFIYLRHVGATRLNVKLWTDAAALEKENGNKEFWIGIGFGIFLIISLTNLFFYATLKEKAFLYHSLLTLCSFGFVIYYSGYMRNTELRGVTAHFWISNMFAMMIFYCAFVYQYFESLRDRKWFRRTLMSMIALSIFGIILERVAPQISFLYFQTLMTPILSFCVMLAIPLAIKGHKSSIFYFASFVFSSAGSILESLSIMNLIPSNLSFWSFFVGYCIHVALLSLAMGNQFYNALKRSRRSVIRLNSKLQDNLDRINIIVEEKTREIKVIMEHIRQGITTVVSADGKIGNEYSRHFKDLFNLKKSDNVFEICFAESNLSEDELDQVRAIVGASIGEDIISFEANGSSLPREIRKSSDQILELDWNPIVNKSDNTVEKILLAVRDVTKIRQLELEFANQQEDLQLIAEIINIPAEKFSTVMNAASELILENKNKLVMLEPSSICDQLYRNLHTAKGLARSYQLKHLSDRIHTAESKYREIRNGEKIAREVLVSDLDEIQGIIDSYLRLSSKKLGRTSDWLNEIKIDRKILEENFNSIREIDFSKLANSDQGRIQALKEVFYSMIYSRISQVIEDLVVSSETISRQIGKAAPEFIFNDQKISFNHEAHTFLINIFTHLVRNSIDHGIEPPDERERLNKRAQGRIYVDVDLFHNQARITFYDDGSGLNLLKIRESATGKGLISAKNGEMTIQKVADLILIPGFSTAESVTDISGRGIGMDAVKSFIEENNGVFEVIVDAEKMVSDQFVPVKFVIILPEKLFQIIELTPADEVA